MTLPDTRDPRLFSRSHARTDVQINSACRVWLARILMLETAEDRGGQASRTKKSGGHGRACCSRLQRVQLQKNRLSSMLPSIHPYPFGAMPSTRSPPPDTQDLIFRKIACTKVLSIPFSPSPGPEVSGMPRVAKPTASGLWKTPARRDVVPKWHLPAPVEQSSPDCPFESGLRGLASQGHDSEAHLQRT